MKQNITIFLFLISVTTISYSQSNWEISEKGIGNIEIGNSIVESLKSLPKDYELGLSRFGIYLIKENGKKILDISPIIKTDTIKSIRIFTDKWKTNDNLKIGLKIKEINKFCKDFFLEYDNKSGSEYYFRTIKFEKNDKIFESIIKFHFIGETPDYLGNYNFNENTGKYDKSLDNNENGVLNFIEIALID
jgi:hypothetical protein